MTEPKWTPGPWRAVSDDQFPEQLHQIWDNDMQVLIARTCFAPKSGANAYLIAAGPELYEALEEAVEKMIESGEFSDEKGSTVYIARAAIAKAHGETQ